MNATELKALLAAYTTRLQTIYKEQGVAMSNKQYIGDGVYIQSRDSAFIGKEIVLTTEDGVSVSNTIILGPAEVANLMKYWEEC
jgi:hypothetical protein